MHVGAVLGHGLPTYGVLLSSWVLACLPFELLDRFALLQRYRCQPEKPVWAKPELRRLAWRMVVRNWGLVLLAVLLSAPLLKVLFPLQLVPAAHASGAQHGGAQSRWSSAFSMLLKLFVALVLDDVWFYAYHRCAVDVAAGLLVL